LHFRVDFEALCPMPTPRASGILLHPTSFPSRFGIGDLGEAAKAFIEFLVTTHQQYWQVLPLGPTGYGNSPYMCYSALAGNPLLISLELLVEKGWLSTEELTESLQSEPFADDHVNYDAVAGYKLYRLDRAHKKFEASAKAPERKAFEQFCQSKASWLEDYALFMALKADQADQGWYEWPKDLAWRSPQALSAAKQRLQGSIALQKFMQWQFFEQWDALRAYANEQGIAIIGDIPIYVAHDSADVWANPENFELDPKTGEVALMAGVPPDYFSETGQLWGNPVYNWKHLKSTGFRWWIARFEAMLDLVDWIRIDHFRGFESFWAVEQGEETAMNGEWVPALGDEFFQVLQQKLGKLPIFAEDLGVITPEVEALRDKYEFPGMKVLHFAFGSDPANPFLPFNYPRNSLVYTGTHDNDTTLGWWEKAGDYERGNLMQYLGSISPEGIHWDLIRLALSSVANISILPFQDVLGLDGNSRMNFPSIAEGNWEWRYRQEMITPEMGDRLSSLTKLFGRAPY
jgi:4-alpha-glucanotransferase